MTTVPEFLYKYVGHQSWHLAILRELRIRFTQPEDLNDLLDCMPALVPPADIVKFVEARFDRLQPEMARRNHSPEQQAAAKAKLLQDFARDPNILVQSCSDIVRSNLNKMGVLSLASHNDNLLMWAHYTDNYKGFVIGFRTNGSPFIKRPGELVGAGELRPAIYSDVRVTLPCDEIDLPNDLHYMKMSPWSYEGEWRIVRLLNECDSVLKDKDGRERIHMCNLDPATVARVDIGANASPATIDAIKAATAPGTPLQHVEVYRAQMDVGMSGLTFVRM